MIPLITALLLATLVGLALRRRDGRFTAPTASSPTDLPVVGSVATLVQISAEACAVCPRVARTLTEVADATPGVAHVELRAEDHPELLTRHDVRRSPTVLVVDGLGQVRGRASGAVTAAQARTVLAPLLDPEALDVHAA
ncbi:thioredoxin family protein [Actinotalea sp. M2MS4P-6]|uniref:thioredoxin family protein n=1 Tax=Actinotalea sp. M2MS4P-6 TaxID=2983762 RepID=UPI0021E37E21|nr:thioredoxin family protein [Actinotalea sp. M2MS4P-6]MCV2396285.1 thioredoxin family protein [Actinotalea sp. M2MS4P-6]